MQRLAEARKYAHEYVERKHADVERFNEFTVATPEEAASVIMHLRKAATAAKHADMGAPAVRNLDAFNHLVRQAKEAVAKQTPESFMLSVPQPQPQLQLQQQQSPPWLHETTGSLTAPTTAALMSRDDISVASEDSFRNDDHDGLRSAAVPRLKSADPATSPERPRRSKHVQKRKEEWNIRTSESFDTGGASSTNRYAVSVKPGQRIRVRALGRAHP